MANKIQVGVLGATGAVGQKFVKLLEDHPWFELTELAASDRSAGKTYRDATTWRQYTPIPDKIKDKTVKPCEPGLDCRVVFSGLDASVAGEVEENFARAGYIVLSNSKNHRMGEDVPLLVPEINPEHLGLLKAQRARRECPVFDIRFIVLSHNTIRGAAGAAILNAELMKVQGYLD